MSVSQSWLKSWVSDQLQQLPDVDSGKDLTLRALSGDAGFRQYFVVNCQPSLLAVCAPKTEGVSESAIYFTQLAEVLREAGVPVPQVLACSEEHNVMLIENFGHQSYFDVLRDESADVLYGQALMVLLRMQQIPQSDIELPVFDETELRQELGLFEEWFVGQLLDYTLDSSERGLLQNAFDFLIEQALSQPRVLVHRDYHCRNLIYREAEAPGVIDFQDALWGPITYDVVSLLRDCYVEWSPEQIERWLMTYGNLAIELNILPEVSTDCWKQWFDTMGLQRHIKVLGIFARLSIRDEKHQYLSDLPLVLRYVMAVAKKYPETLAFYEWVRSHLLPIIEQQAWYEPQLITGDCA